jgi:hypothetical protein
MSDPLAPLASLTLPDSQRMTASAQAALSMASEYKITCDESYQLAAEELTAIKAKQKLLEAQRTAITGPMNTALKAVNDLFRQPTTLLVQAETAIKRSMLAYTDYVADQAREAQLAAAAAERAAREAADAQRREADALARAGNVEAAAAAMDAATSTEMAVAMSAPMVPVAPKVTGISKPRVTYKARVSDMRAFVQHALTDENAMAMLGVSEQALNGLARALGHGLKMPGVEVYEERTIAARAA